MSNAYEEALEKEHPEKMKSTWPKMPEELKKDLASIGDSVLFVISPPAYFGKKVYVENKEKNRYVKSKKAIATFAATGLICFLGCELFDKGIQTVFEDSTVKGSEQRVHYDFGDITFSQKYNLTVKDKSKLVKGLFPFVRTFARNSTYAYTKGEEWTSFEGIATRNRIYYRIRGTMPLTTNFAEVTAEDLSRYTRDIKLLCASRTDAEHIFGVNNQVK